MKLRDLLGELRGNLLRDASTLQNGPPDAYWSDEALVRYIDEGQKRFARRSLCLRDDTTSSVTTVTLKDGVSIYKLDPSILRVTSARHQDSQTDLLRMAHLTGYSFSNPGTDVVDGVTRQALGQPSRFTTDEGLEVNDLHQIRMAFDPKPNLEQNNKVIRLRVLRLPLDNLTTANLDAEPEIPEDWHLDMLEWAAWRALRNWDVDSEDRRKAQQHRDRFDEAIKECLKEVEQKKMFEPVTWALGGLGFGGYVR